MPKLPKGVAVEVSLIAGENARNMKTIVTAKDAPAPVGPYSHAVGFDGLLFLSGQICKEGGIVEQAVEVFSNFGKVLKAGNASPGQLAAATLYLPDLGNLQAIEDHIRDFIPIERKDKLEIIQPSKLPFGVGVELSGIASKG
jgi:2-iminobutanoate/2-iminopropanoate deaminase